MCRVTKTLALFLCLLSAGVAGAQTGNKISQLLKTSFTAPKIVETLPPTAQFKALSSTFKSLEETRRALVQSPTWGLSSEFASIAKRLQEMGLPLPKQPGKNATAAERALYLKEVNRVLLAESSTLGLITNQKPRPAASEKALRYDPKKATQAQTEEFESLFQQLSQGEETFSVGTPNWNEIQIFPNPAFTNPSSAAYVNQETFARFSETAKVSLPRLYDAILNETMLSSYQKQALICAIDEAASRLSPLFVRMYIFGLNKIPSVQYVNAVPPAAGNALKKYAVAAQINLLKRLEKNGQWTEAELDNFAEVSVFLEPARAKAVLGAVTFLEPKAAQWLLTHPLNDQNSQKIITLTNMLRNSKKSVWPNGNISPKMPAQIPFDQLRKERVKALSARVEILEGRLKKLAARRVHTQNARELLEENISAKLPTAGQAEKVSLSITAAAKEARLTRMINKVQTEILDILKEINKL